MTTVDRMESEPKRYGAVRIVIELRDGRSFVLTGPRDDVRYEITERGNIDNDERYYTLSVSGAFEYAHERES